MFNLDGAPPQRNAKIGPKSSNSKSSIHLSCGLKSIIKLPYVICKNMSKQNCGLSKFTSSQTGFNMILESHELLMMFMVYGGDIEIRDTQTMQTKQTVGRDFMDFIRSECPKK